MWLGQQCGFRITPHSYIKNKTRLKPNKDYMEQNSQGTNTTRPLRREMGPQELYASQPN